LRHTSRLLENEEDWDRHADTAAESENLLDSLVLREAMTVLSEEERQIVVLHALSDMKHRQIAEVMGMPLPTVLSKYSRAMKKLRNRLQGDDL
jgi:RNA polymerase sigma-70 factor (ECF subfamily)